MKPEICSVPRTRDLAFLNRLLKVEEISPVCLACIRRRKGILENNRNQNDKSQDLVVIVQPNRHLPVR